MYINYTKSILTTNILRDEDVGINKDCQFNTCKTEKSWNNKPITKKLAQLKIEGRFKNGIQQEK